ncbi:hypothetical protein BDR22DRAFT_897664 [Usnea florida]
MPSTAEDRPAPLRLGSIAPNFQAETTNGPIDFHEFVGDNWVVLFSHPEDYTPVCTTELGAFAKLEPEFTKRGVKLIGLSANTIDSHGGWIKDIDEISGSKLRFPIIGDKERKVAYLYDMLDHQDTTNVDQKGIAFTIRSVFIIDPKKTIRLILSYPASTGRNTAEVLRVVDSLQTGDKNKITTPINWIPGDDVIVHPSVKTEQAKEQYPDLKIVKPYLRFTPLPKEQTTTDATPHSTAPSPATNHSPPQSTGTTNLSGLVCNVHKCTGKEPRALVGATTTILGDKLYVFGGRVLSRRHPHLTSDLYELDLVRRHWIRLETSGDVPPPRYFHSMCALGDTKLICYGGMSPVNSSSQARSDASQGQAKGIDSQSEMIVMSDIHVFDAPTRRWTSIATANTPQGRYAHCAAVLPSSATFTSANAPLSAIHHNPPSATPNQGSLGVALDGTGGAEMVVVGGQDSANTYIEQISVFNLRSLKWTATSSLGRSCGAYRSVVTPLTSMPASKLGKDLDQDAEIDGAIRKSDRSESESAMLIYSNYNFLDVKLELQVRLADGSLVEKPMTGQFSPPGLRFPNGGVLDNHFVVSGTYLTSSKQEYALWALDLKTLTWSRIDAGGGVFSQGSWNRGVLWPRRNTFVILGNRKRSLVEDYNHRRINFSNLCMVELEAFGLYDNPRRAWPASNFPSISAPVLPPSVVPKNLASAGRPLPSAAVDLGLMAMNLKDLADMDLIAIGQERIPVNSYLLAHRWGPFFVHLLRESSGTTSSSSQNDASSSSDGGTLRPGNLNPASVTSRNSSITITPSITTTASAAPSSLTANSNSFVNNKSLDPAKLEAFPPSSRPRQLYLPHTPLTIRALVHYLYTSTLPGPNHPLCTPQILCSLLQIARPYRVDGLLEATVERLHQILDGRNAAAVFNAAAMAAGGGRGTGVAFSKEGEVDNDEIAQGGLNITRLRDSRQARSQPNDRRESDDTTSEISGSEMSSSAASESESDAGGDSHERRVANGTEEVWAGGISCVVGLQKRGLRGLMEGRRARERGQTVSKGGALGANGTVNGNDGSAARGGFPRERWGS